MADLLTHLRPGILPPLDGDFRPAVLYNRAFQDAVTASGAGVPLAIALERADGCVSRLETHVFADNHPLAGENLLYAERLFKFLLWQCGGWKASVAGPAQIVEELRSAYAPGGRRAFDAGFMGTDVYQKPFTVVACAPDELPAERELQQAIGRHLDGCRVGIDLGASDLKVSAVQDGTPLFSQEIIWEPRKHADPAYHEQQIWNAIQMAAAKLPRVDCVGVSSAGIYIANRAMIASLFRAIPQERFAEVRELFLRMQARMGVPFVVVNDGEVTALAGSMWLDDAPVLGIALGSSEAAGYVDQNGNLTTWLNELAFAPLDYNPNAARDEWSQDAGVGATYFSQQCVFRLLPRAGIEIPANRTDAEKLKAVQDLLESGHAGALKIWQTIGVYMGYAIAHYAAFYRIKHLLLLGRCTSGSGGKIIQDQATRVLEAEFPDLAHQIILHIPDESSRRLGQSVVAASLPFLTHEGAS